MTSPTDQFSSTNQFLPDTSENEDLLCGLPPAPDLDSATGRGGNKQSSKTENEGLPDTGGGPGNGNDDSNANATGSSGAEGTGGTSGTGGTGPANTGGTSGADDNDDATILAANGSSGSNEIGSERPDSNGLGSEELRRGYLPRRACELLPQLLAGPASRIGDRRERDVFLTGALPVWAGALPNVRFRYGGCDMSPNLYSATIAPPASGKSALRHARRYGRPLSSELHAGNELHAGSPGAPEAGGEAQGGEAAEVEGAEVEGAEVESTEGQDACDQGMPGRRLFLAADTSAAAIKNRLAESPHGVICETEFHALSQALGSSWGKFSDVLLKGFQNETIKTARSSTGTVTIPHPAPSIALAGTPRAFEGVVSGTDDGLFSRFLLYRFDREFEWRAQFGEGGRGPGQILEDAAEDFRVGYRRLQAREEPLRITVPERLRAVHNQAFQSLTEKWKDEEDVPRSLQASLTRSGLQAVKIATVLRGIRLIGSGAPLGTIQSAALHPEDMEAGLRLALTYLLHGAKVETRFREGPRPQAAPQTGLHTGPKAGLTEQKRNYLEALPEGPFSTQEAKALASTFDVSERNAQRWLKSWREAGLLTKPRRGTWAKPGPQLAGIAGAESVISVINDIPALPISSSAQRPNT